MTALQHERSTSTVTVQQLQQEVTRLSEANKTLQVQQKAEGKRMMMIKEEEGKEDEGEKKEKEKEEEDDDDDG